MLSASDPQLKEMAAFALGRLAQNAHNQAGIVQASMYSNSFELFCFQLLPTRIAASSIKMDRFERRNTNVAWGR
jgi:hypothetical protein